MARGEFEEAGSALEALRAVQRLVGTAPLRACGDLAEGVLACARGDHDRARALLEDAVDRFERSGAPFEAARARIELADVPARARPCRGGRARGGRARSSACARWAPSSTPGGRGASSTAAAGGGRRRGGLTPREREVLRLLADGLTNRQIAERLVVSEHTVHRHVTNLLRKLDLPSRTAAAAYAVRSGLLDRAPA